jgi:hypothetical protein
MTEEPPFDGEPALYRRWQSLGVSPVPVPSASLIAAYAEFRLTDPDEIERVEAALAADPAMFDAMLSARHMPAPEIVSVTLLRRAQGLVDGAPQDNVVPFRRRAVAGPSRLRQEMLAWAGVAASLILISTVGFNLGFELEQASNAAPAGTQIDLLDQMAGGGVG